MPLRWPSWIRGLAAGLAFSTMAFVTVAGPVQPWWLRLAVSAWLGAVLGSLNAIDAAGRLRRVLGGRLSGAQRAQVEAAIRTPANPHDPRLWQAARNLAED